MTDAEARTLRNIMTYREQHGISPSLLDLARMSGSQYKGGPSEIVRRLLARGLLEASPGSREGYVVSRSYRPSPEGLAALATLDGGPSVIPDPCPTCGQPTVAP